MLVTGDLPVDTRLITVSNDGRWLVARTAQSTVLIDLTSGRVQTVGMPAAAVIARSN